MMTLADVLARKGDAVVTARPDDTLDQVLHILVEANIGALVVTDDGVVVGILSERDILQFMARASPELSTTPVREIMTREVVVATPGERVERALELMTEHRIRHVPIMESGSLAGIVSIRDLVNASRDAAEWENRELRRYIATAG